MDTSTRHNVTGHDVTDPTVEETVRSSLLFRWLDDETSEALRANMRRVDVRRGRVLFGEGEPGDSLYVVVSGKIAMVRQSSLGRENLLAVLGPGQIFGELSLFDEGVRDASAKALADTTLLALAHDQLGTWLDTRPALAQGLLMQLAGRLRRANDVVADLVFADVPTRVAKAVLDLAERFGVPDPESGPGAILVPHGLTQTDLAQLVGTARETVNKALADFVARGWVRLDSRALVLLDRAAMESRAR